MNALITATIVGTCFLLVNILMFSVRCRRRARAIGWTDLAQKYRSGDPIQGILFAEGGLVGRLGQQGSSGLPLTMILASRGVVFRVGGTLLAEINGLIDRFFPPLFLPWQEILSIERQSALFGDYYRIRLASTAREWRIDAHFGAALLSAWKFAHGLSDEPPRGVPVPW